MKLTNKHNLPEAVVRALSFDNYSKGEATFSVTQLLDSPRVRALQWLHKESIEEDVVDQFFSLLGRAIHQIMEWGAEQAAAGTEAEERLFLKVDVDGMTVTISGAMDLQEEQAFVEHEIGGRTAYETRLKISDHKVTSVYAYQSGKKSWEEQLNLYAHLVRETKNKKVGSLQIIVFLRDWQSSKSGQDGYPSSPIVVVPIKLWSPEEAAQFLQERLRLHLEAGDAVMSGEEPLPCTEDEMWRDSPKWAVMKRDGKRALKVYADEREARTHVALQKEGQDLVIEERAAKPRRCAGNWCKVAQWCVHGREFLEEEADPDDFI